MTSWKNNNTLKTRRLIEEVLDPVEKSEKVVAKDLEHLRALIYERIKDQGFKANLNDIDTSNITDMSQLFASTYGSDGGYNLRWLLGDSTDAIDFSRFDGDISQWDVSNVKSMNSMFYESKFNGDISQWDVSNVENMKWMFRLSKFNGDISNWDVSKVQDMAQMFRNSKFTGDISNWNVSRVRNMTRMFYKSKFNGDLSKWKVPRGRYMKNVFDDSPLEGKEPDWYKMYMESTNS